MQPVPYNPDEREDPARLAEEQCDPDVRVSQPMRDATRISIMERADDSVNGEKAAGRVYESEPVGTADVTSPVGGLVGLAAPNPDPVEHPSALASQVVKDDADAMNVDAS